MKSRSEYLASVKNKKQNKNKTRTKKQKQQGKKVCGVGYNDGNRTKRTREWPKIHCQVFSYKLHLRIFGKTAKYVQNNYDRRWGWAGPGIGLIPGVDAICGQSSLVPGTPRKSFQAQEVFFKSVSFDW